MGTGRRVREQARYVRECVGVYGNGLVRGSEMVEGVVCSSLYMFRQCSQMKTRQASKVCKAHCGQRLLCCVVYACHVD